MLYYRYSSIIFFLVCFLPVHAQVEITPVFNTVTDSNLLNRLQWARFDSSGKHYVACQNFHETVKSVITIDGVSKEYISVDNYSLLTEELYNIEENSIYYILKDAHAHIKGPLRGTIKSYYANADGSHAYFSVQYHDSLALFIDDKQIAIISGEHKKIYGNSWYSEQPLWCVLSPGGNALYFIPHDTQYILYYNGKAIDTSFAPYASLAVNNNGKYMFAKWVPDNYRDTYGAASNCLVFHSPTGQIFIADSARDDGKINSLLYENGNYTFTYSRLSFDEAAIINNKHYTIPLYQVFANNGKYLLLYKENGATNYTQEANGKTTQTTYNKVFCPTIDSNGNYAYCGTRGYYMYANTNGIEDKKPISKRGIRGHPYSISTDGHVVAAYPRQDSVYLYHDDTLLFGYASASQDVCEPYFESEVWARTVALPKNFYTLLSKESLLFVQNGYVYHVPVAYNNNPARYTNSDGKNTFILFYNDQLNEYLILYNGKTFTMPANSIERNAWKDTRILNCCMYNDTLIFYGVNNNKIWRYKISL